MAGVLGGNVQAIPHDAIIRPVGKAAHVSTPHTTTATTTKNVPPWLNTAALTPAQMQTEANTEVNNAIDPQIEGVRSQQALYDAQQKAYQAAMTGFYSALAPALGDIQGHVSDAYNSAASTMGNVAKGYSGVLGANAASDNSTANAALARAGQAPLAAPGAGLTNAFDATNGGLEGSAFAAQGAAKAADAANRPAIWAAQGRDSMTEAIQKAVAGDQTYADQITKIYQTVPALRDTILKQVQTAEIQKQQLKDTEQTLGIKSQVAGQTAAEKVATLNAEIAHWNQQSKNAQLSITERAQASAAARNLRLQIAQIQAAAKKANATGPATKYKTVGDVVAATQKEITYLHAHPTYGAPPAGSLPGTKGAPIYPQWQAVMNSMFSSYVTPYLNSLPASQRAAARKQIKQALINQMTQAGFSQGG